jgi:hypothetical protein
MVNLIIMMAGYSSVPMREEIRLFLGTLAILSSLLSLAFALNAYNELPGPHFALSCGVFAVLALITFSLFFAFHRNSMRARLAEHAPTGGLFSRLRTDFRSVNHE